jgi:3-hydroxymyristoyl/3-hydroxydecanoyl-(acyl carrier protein) dehydratase
MVYPVTFSDQQLLAVYLQLPNLAEDCDLRHQVQLVGRELLPELAKCIVQPQVLWSGGRDWPFSGTADDEAVFLHQFSTVPPDTVRRPDFLEQSREGETHHYRFSVPRDLLFFQGHFDQEAVVAGVCELKWLAELIEAITNAPLKLVRMEAVKFHRLLFPNDVCQLDLRFDATKQKWIFKFYTDTYKVASGRLCLT